jgi:hypothetical protein
VIGATPIFVTRWGFPASDDRSALIMIFARSAKPKVAPAAKARTEKHTTCDLWAKDVPLRLSVKGSAR